MAINTRERNLNTLNDLANMSFDGENGLFVVEPVTLNPITGAVERTTTIQGNAALTLTYTGDKCTKITKTVGTVNYEKDLSYTGELLTGITAWAAV